MFLARAQTATHTQRRCRRDDSWLTEMGYPGGGLLVVVCGWKGQERLLLHTWIPVEQGSLSFRSPRRTDVGRKALV